MKFFYKLWFKLTATSYEEGYEQAVIDFALGDRCGADRCCCASDSE